MSQMNSSLGSNDVDAYLRNYDNHYAMEILVAMIVLGILMLVGFVGNSLVCYLYICKFNRSTTRCFIVALAVYDLISCAISIPVEIADMRFNYTFGAYGFCKVARAFVAFSSLASGTVLVAVAVDRYKKICRPLKAQTTPLISKVAIVICSLIAFIVALPAAVIYGSRTVTTDDIRVNGSDCSTADEYMGTPYPLIYNAVQFLIFISATVTLTVLYCLIWRQVCRQQAFRDSVNASSRPERPKLHIFAMLKDQSSDSMDTSDDLLSTSSDAAVAHHAVRIPLTSSSAANTRTGLLDTSNDSELETSFTDNQNSNRFNICKTNSSDDQFRRKNDSGITKMQPKKKMRTKTRRDEKGVRRTTFMLFLITLVFVLSYFPHLGLMAARAVNKHLFDGLQGAESAAYNLFLRSYFINSASNPIIYSLYNAHFRRELKLLFNKLTCRS